MILFAIVSSQRGEWLKEAERQGERGSEAKKEREFANRPRLPRTCLCFLQKQPRLSWESLTDSSLCASLLCDSYHTTEASVLCSSSPSYSEGWKYIFPHCIQTWVCHSPHVWRRNENHQNEIHNKKDNQTKQGEKCTWNFIMVQYRKWPARCVP